MRLLLFEPRVDAADPVHGFAIGWMRALARRVRSLEIITGRVGEYELPSNVTVRCFDAPRRLQRLLRFQGALRQALRGAPIDAAFSHMIPLATVLAAPLLGRTPIVTWFAHPQPSWTLRVAQQLSAAVVTSLPSSYPYRTQRLHVLGHGIETHRFAFTNPSPGLPMILCAGRISAVKDHPTLITALRDNWHQNLACIALGRIGPPAKEAVPALTALAEQGSEYVRDDAADALEKIRSEED